jgi:hypothetical protein
MRKLREQKRILFTGGLLFVFGIIVLLTTNVAVTQTENMGNENRGPSQPLPLPPINIQQIQQQQQQLQQQQQQQPQPQQPSSTVVKSTHPILFDEKANFARGSGSAFILGLAPTVGTLKNLTAFVELPPGVGETATITVDKNFAKTPLTCTITGNLQLCFDNVHSVTVAQGDFISVEIALSPGAQGFAEFGGGLGFQEN